MQHYRSNASVTMRGPDYRQMPSGACFNRRETDLENMPLAMAYVPWQSWRSIYETRKGFCRGTIFEELDKPFRGMGGGC